MKKKEDRRPKTGDGSLKIINHHLPLVPRVLLLRGGELSAV